MKIFPDSIGRRQWHPTRNLSINAPLLGPVQHARCLPASKLRAIKIGMKTVTLSAHVSGNTIQLDEPFPLPDNARLLVTILPDNVPAAEQLEWYALSKAGLARAYSDDEPDYPASLIRSAP